MEACSPCWWPVVNALGVIIHHAFLVISANLSLHISDAVVGWQCSCCRVVDFMRERCFSFLCEVGARLGRASSCSQMRDTVLLVRADIHNLPLLQDRQAERNLRSLSDRKAVIHFD